MARSHYGKELLVRFYNMFSVPCQVLTRATFIIVDLCYDRD